MLDMKCERCGHTWFTKTEKKPQRCPHPKCNSLYYEKPLTPYWKRVRENNKLKKAAQNQNKCDV